MSTSRNASASSAGMRRPNIKAVIERIVGNAAVRDGRSCRIEDKTGILEPACLPAERLHRLDALPANDGLHRRHHELCRCSTLRRCRPHRGVQTAFPENESALVPPRTWHSRYDDTPARSRISATAICSIQCSAPASSGHLVLLGERGVCISSSSALVVPARSASACRHRGIVFLPLRPFTA